MPAPPHRRVILMGLRASGKTTLGRALARRLSLPFIDLDDSTRALLRVGTVREAFDTLGEPAFRNAESHALRDALERPPAVIALGGGTPTAPGAAGLLRDAARARRAHLLYLRAQPRTLRSRLSGDDPNRPSLTQADPIEEVERVFDARDPLYRSLATHTLDTDSLTLEQTLHAIASLASRDPHPPDAKKA